MHVRSLVAINGSKFELNMDFVAVVHGIKAHYSSTKGRSDSVVSLVNALCLVTSVLHKQRSPENGRKRQNKSLRRVLPKGSAV